MPGPLDVLEKLMEEAVEGTVQRVFRPKLQPVQLAKAAVRRMEAEQVVGTSGLEVPNSFQIALHPRDFARFVRFQVALQAELESYLARYAQDRGWHPVGPLSVTLQEDSAAPAGRPRVAARMIDVLPIESGRTAVAARVSPSPTATVPPVATPRSAAAALPQPWLVAETGERFPLARDVATIGRAFENDIVIADSRVSRFHAEIRRQAGRFLVRDLGSTNGTLVADREADSTEVADGETLSLGGCRLTFRLT